MRCPHCKTPTRLFKSDGAVVKLRAPILVFSEDGRCVTNCPKCRNEIQVPITLQKSALDDNASPKLVLGKHRLTQKPPDP